MRLAVLDSQCSFDLDAEIATKSSMSQAGFLFVNKNAQSKVLSRSDKNGSRLIFRHVQHRTVKLPRKKTRESPSAGSACVAEPVRLCFRDEEGSNTIGALRRSGNAHSRKQLLSANFLEGDSFDPFDCFPVRIDQEVSSVLQFYLRNPVMTDNNPKSVANRNLTKGLSSALPVSRIIRGSMSDPLHMYALLTATSARIMQTSTSTRQSVDAYMHQAIQHLRTFLLSCTEQTVIEPQTILNILLLALAEYYRQDYQAALSHLRILRDLIRNLDMSKHFDGFVYELIYNFDMILSMESGSKPRFPILWGSDKSAYLTDLVEPRIRSKLLRQRESILSTLCFDPGYAEHTIFQQRILKVLPDALRVGGLSDEGQAISPDLVYLMHVTYDRRLPCEAVKLGTVWVAKSAYALLHRLLSHPTQRHMTAWLTLRQEECCRLASIITLTYLIQNLGLGFPRSVILNMLKLRRLMSDDVLSWGSTIGDRLLLWVLAMGHFAARDTKEAHWFSANARVVAIRLNVVNYQELFGSLLVCLRRMASPPFSQTPGDR